MTTPDGGRTPAENEAAGVLRQWIEHRRELAGRLHDGCQQDLSILTLEVGRLTRSLDDGPVRVALEELAAQATLIQDELRAVTIELYPPALTTKGLVEALHAERRRHAFPVEVTVEPGLSIPARLEAGVFFFCRALLTATGSRTEQGVTLDVKRSGDLISVIARSPVGSEAADEIEALVQPLAEASGGRCVWSPTEGSLLLETSWPVH